MSESDSNVDLPKNPFQTTNDNDKDDDFLAKAFHDKATIEELHDDEDVEDVDPEHYKQQGNAAYVAKDFTSALAYYDQAIRCCSRAMPKNDCASTSTSKSVGTMPPGSSAPKDSGFDSMPGSSAPKDSGFDSMPGSSSPKDNSGFDSSCSESTAHAHSEDADQADSSSDTPKHDPRLAIYHGNRSACFMMLEQYEDAIEASSASLRINPKYVKVLMRRAKAYEETEKFMSAAADLESVLKIDENYVPARASLARIQPRAKKEQEEMQTKVMGQLKDLGNTVLGKFGMSLDNFQAVKDPNTGSYSINYNS